MRTRALRTDPDRAWSAFEPGPDAPWDLPRVAHLHRRAGFAASWEILHRDLREGPIASIDRLLTGEETSLDGTPATEFDSLMDTMASSSASITRLQASWLYRMIFTPHPLKERMTLFWHNHFATSDAKVKSVLLMRRQNDLLRRLALGDFSVLLSKMSQDPAMLIWLDCTANRKAHPNENYAREVMELFTLGRGRYTEKDIQEAARAFTGSFIRDDQYAEIPSQHDGGEKTILGKTGRFRGDDVSRILLDQPTCAEFVCGKLFAHFVSEVEKPSKALISPLAEAFRKSNYDIKVPVAMILRSKLFHDPSSRRKRVKSPIEFAVGSIRALEILSPTVSADALADACDQMGQALFLPPSVAGWDGGSTWINTTTSLARSNFALGLVGKDAKGIGGRFDAQVLLDRHDIKDAGRFFVELLVQDAFGEKSLGRTVGNAAEAATLVLSSPEYQLG